jgi:hypothetical protein
MNVALAALAVLTVAGGVLAVSTRDVRTAVLGLLLVLLGAPFIADPLPGPVPVIVRLAAALLATRFLLIGLRGEDVTAGTRIGWPAEALLAAAAGVIGFGSHGLGAAGLGPPEAQAAGFALAALAVAPLVTGRDVLRIGIGAVLLVVGGVLIRTGLGAPAGDGEQLIGALLTIGLGGAVAVISMAARAGGGLEAFDGAVLEHGPRPPDAHRPSERERAKRAAHWSPERASAERASAEGAGPPTVGSRPVDPARRPAAGRPAPPRVDPGPGGGPGRGPGGGPGGGPGSEDRP